MGNNWWIGDRRATDVLGADLEVDLTALTTAIREAAASYHPKVPLNREAVLRGMNGELSFEDGVADSELVLAPETWSDNSYHMLAILRLAYLRPGMAWFRSSVPNSEKASKIIQIVNSVSTLTPELAKQPNRVREFARKIAYAANASIVGESPEETRQQLEIYGYRPVAPTQSDLTPEELSVITEIEKLIQEASAAAAAASP